MRRNEIDIRRKRGEDVNKEKVKEKTENKEEWASK
jgi:hypothetical protein